jgi:hypothetical protein
MSQYSKFEDLGSIPGRDMKFILLHLIYLWVKLTGTLS